MPDRTPTLTEEAAAAVLAVPGVIRLEPTLLNALRHLQAGLPSPAPGANAAAEGIRIRRRPHQVDCHVDIVVDQSRPAAAVAHDTQAVLQSVLRTHSLTVGDVTVAVLNLAP